jgi:nucleotide-binding universal stress UspA family protein
MIKDILVHVDGTRAGERRIAYAFDLAKRHHARLTGLHVTAPADVAPRYKPSMVERVATDMEQHSAEDARIAEVLFKSAASKRSAQALWQALEGGMSRQICKLARCSDLVVLGQYESEGSAEHHPSSLAEDVAAACGRPVLVVPAAVAEGQIRRALIAWDGGREAVRALHDALPLLHQANAVAEIATIDEPASNLEPLLEHLRHHQIAVEGGVHLNASGSVAGLLVDRLKQGHFDLLIMGASGHAVWLEFLFGGTTPSALMNASTPVLISY